MDRAEKKTAVHLAHRKIMMLITAVFGYRNGTAVRTTEFFVVLRLALLFSFSFYEVFSQDQTSVSMTEHFGYLTREL